MAHIDPLSPHNHPVRKMLILMLHMGKLKLTDRRKLVTELVSIHCPILHLQIPEPGVTP